MDAAYGYDGKVLFKPTLSTSPYTFRETKAGALSYFIGTECLNMVGEADEQFPPGNHDGSMRHLPFVDPNIPAIVRLVGFVGGPISWELQLAYHDEMLML